jgi:hypothetical protein
MPSLVDANDILTIAVSENIVPVELHAELYKMVDYPCG